MIIRTLLVLLTTFSVAFALNMQELQKKIDDKDEKFISELIEKTKVYENIDDIPDGLKAGDSVITEDDYGAKTFYLLNENEEMEEVGVAYFNVILNANSASTFSNMLIPSGMAGKAYDPMAKTGMFKEYVSETDTVRIGFLDIPERADYVEKALNYYLLDNDIEPNSIVNIQIIQAEKNKTMWIFYRP